MKKKRQIVKLNRIQKAILALAKHCESCPYNDYKIVYEILDILGYEEVQPKSKREEV